MLTRALFFMFRATTLSLCALAGLMASPKARERGRADHHPLEFHVRHSHAQPAHGHPASHRIRHTAGRRQRGAQARYLLGPGRGAARQLPDPIRLPVHECWSERGHVGFPGSRTANACRRAMPNTWRRRSPWFARTGPSRSRCGWLERATGQFPPSAWRRAARSNAPPLSSPISPTASSWHRPSCRAQARPYGERRRPSPRQS